MVLGVRVLIFKISGFFTFKSKYAININVIIVLIISGF